ncbi:hypothetical protein LR48_Vigan10g216300 [Vigna angularis]|uniref:Uncharacterized protein n=1 Tax=Phaseolus angularis TaxID=3914 RepID=A0A0L9VMH6_PHAAN|nr:hypothetical protein LR48_Vigan10g216300 [Vigna angularis]
MNSRADQNYERPKMGAPVFRVNLGISGTNYNHGKLRPLPRFFIGWTNQDYEKPTKVAPTV